MRQKIIISLFIVLVLLACNTAISHFLISGSTKEFNRVIRQYQIEQMRRSLVISMQTVQANLYTINSPLQGDTDVIVLDVIKLERAAKQCTGCHHPPALMERIRSMQSIIQVYKQGLSYLITMSANPVRVNELKDEVAAIGNKLISMTEEMSHTASIHLDKETDRALSNISRVKSILLVTVIFTFALGIFIALTLTRSITRPVTELLEATRLIASGKLGTTISYQDGTEFGELTANFNRMSAAIKEGYDKVQGEIQERLRTENKLARSEKFLNTIFDSIRDPFCIFDREYKIIRANHAYAELKHTNLEDIYGSRCYEALYSSDSRCTNCIVDTTFRSKDPCAKEKLVKLTNGDTMWLDVFTYPIYDAEGNVSFVIEYIRDISERKKGEIALRETKERYALAARGAKDGLWDWDLQLNSVYYSPRWKYILGYQDSEVGQSVNDWLNRIHPDDRTRVKTELQRHIEGSDVHFETEHRLLGKDGTYRWVLCRGLAVRDINGTAYRIAGSMSDISSRKETEQQLIFDALHDSLTGLPNRALFLDRLGHAIDREKRNEHYLFAVLFLDIDRFKVLNDSMGHSAGDELLTIVSQRLAECLRTGDTVARFGGDEFAVLLEDLKNENEAIQITARIQETLSLPVVMNGQELYTSASIGIVFSSSGYENADNLLRNADIAMYHAKHNGSRRYDVFNNEMYADVVARLEMETDLRIAMKEGQFILHYQPIVDVSTGRIIGFESLIRWMHPVQGLIYPDQFIPIAEDAGLIFDIGKWAIREACQQLQIWQTQFPADPPLTMSVNISSKQLLPDLLRQIERVMKGVNLKSNSFIIEITESMIMENADTVFPLLDQLRSMNIKLYIDDFGTGYSSLSYLHDLPVDVLKIDRSFISRLGQQGEDHKIVKAIISLARSLNMQVVAEGVEQESQFEYLKHLQCDYMQGFYTAKPMPGNEVEHFIEQRMFDFTRSIAN